MSCHRQAHRPVDPRQFDNGRHVFAVAQPGPAVFYRHQHPHQALVAQLPEQIGGEVLLLVPLPDIGPDQSFAQVPNRLHDEFGESGPVGETYLVFYNFSGHFVCSLCALFVDEIMSVTGNCNVFLHNHNLRKIDTKINGMHWPTV